MKKKLIVAEIRGKIHTIRGKRVILDEDLAEFYQVGTKFLNRAVKRNIERFPEDFMFQINDFEFSNLKSQFATTRSKENLRFQNGTSKQGGRRYLPYVFTEQGVAMLSGVLRSNIAVQVSIQIINAFVAMRRFFSQNAEIFLRIGDLEKKQLENDHKFELVFKALEKHKPKQGIFFDGQIFDAYEFVSKLIKEAKSSIILVDNYIDETILTMFSKTKVDVIIYTKITNSLKLDLNKYRSQYKNVKIKEFTKSHDRFLIIDNKEVYHFGASLKDLGKKWFAFSKFDKDTIKILNKLEE